MATLFSGEEGEGQKVGLINAGIEGKRDALAVWSIDGLGGIHESMGCVRG